MNLRKLLLLPLTLPLLCTAQLAPQAPAPLFAHLVEVNKEWRHMNPAPESGERMTYFTNEADRIATHLRLVRTHLLAHTPEGLSATQAAARHQLLDDLGRYAERGLFPQNHVLPYRNPVFIDPQYTACAVGQLMIESGDRELAECIASGINLAYVSEILRDEQYAGSVADWATAHGFTADELAWIQPAYAPPTNFYDLGGGTDTTVHTLARLAGGQLVVAGEFTTAGPSTSAQHVATWNGTNYNALGGGVNGEVRCALEHNGLLYLGGQFQSGSMDLAVWNASTWTYQNVFAGMSPMTHDLQVINGQLHAAGESSGFSGTFHQVRAWDGSYWNDVGNAMNGPILAMERHNGLLVIGGAFTGGHSFGTPNTDVQHVAVLDSTATTWVQYMDGLDATVYDLMNMNGMLYAGGSFYNNIVPAFGLARLDATTNTWEHLMPNHPSYLTPGAGPTEVRCLAHYNDEVYFGGNFFMDWMMGTYGRHAAKFMGTADQVTPLAILDAPVNAMLIWDDKLIIGGEFSTSAFQPAKHVAYMDLASGMNEGPVRTALTLWPTPATEVVHVDATALRGGRIRVVDMQGRVAIADALVTNDRVTLDVSALAPGLYHVQVQGEGVAATGRFVKP
ncbi:MAG: T9SS type A sorting domain-containing protein [Flavobacteriales bacterium]|nr:T9SS type A sorting domain-containing protein [Flavobacteriales bacterium]